jgi:hypothetical protein
MNRKISWKLEQAYCRIFGKTPNTPPYNGRMYSSGDGFPIHRDGSPIAPCDKLSHESYTLMNYINHAPFRDGCIQFIPGIRSVG